VPGAWKWRHIIVYRKIATVLGIHLHLRGTTESTLIGHFIFDATLPVARKTSSLFLQHICRAPTRRKPDCDRCDLSHWLNDWWLKVTWSTIHYGPKMKDRFIHLPPPYGSRESREHLGPWHLPSVFCKASKY